MIAMEGGDRKQKGTSLLAQTDQKGAWREDQQANGAE